jgi:hypothetical protein
MCRPRFPCFFNRSPILSGPPRDMDAAQVPREIVHIPRVPCPEAAATLFAAVAYPDDLKSRGRFHEALCVQTLAWIAKNFPSTGHQPIRPQYLIPAEADRLRHLRLGLTQLANRAKAGEMVLPFLEYELKGTTEWIGEKPTSINKMAARIAAECGRNGGNAENVKHRVWAPSRSVAHVAAAIRLVRLRVAARRLGRSDSLREFPFDPELLIAPELLKTLIRWSEQARTTLGNSLVAETDTIQFIAI